MCLECKKYFTRPLSHVVQVHAMTSQEYRKKHGLDNRRGIASEQHKEVMRTHVFDNGTVNNLKKGKQHRFKKGNSHNYQRSEQTITRLKHNFEIIRRKTGRQKIKKMTIKGAECAKPKEIYPRAFKKDNNYCGVICRNIKNNKRVSVSSLNKKSQGLN